MLSAPAKIAHAAAPQRLAHVALWSPGGLAGRTDLARRPQPARARRSTSAGYRVRCPTGPARDAIPLCPANAPRAGTSSLVVSPTLRALGYSDARRHRPWTAPGGPIDGLAGALPRAPRRAGARPARLPLPQRRAGGAHQDRRGARQRFPRPAHPPRAIHQRRARARSRRPSWRSSRSPGSPGCSTVSPTSATARPPSSSGPTDARPARPAGPHCRARNSHHPPRHPRAPPSLVRSPSSRHRSEADGRGAKGEGRKLPAGGPTATGRGVSCCSPPSQSCGLAHLRPAPFAPCPSARPARATIGAPRWLSEDHRRE